MSLSSPFSGDVKTPPSPTSVSAGALRDETPQLRKPEDTSVIKTVFYQDTPSLKWSNGALASPMGTGIIDPKSTPKSV